MNQPYPAKNYARLLGLKGLSDRLLQNHFTLYEGYVKNANELAGLLRQKTADGQTGAPEFAELKRRFGWELNGLKLHEYYFENLSRDPGKLASASELGKKIAACFGSFELWQADFLETAKMRGIGWVILYYEKEGGRLYNLWINEHDVGHVSGLKPLLVLDVFEHAYMIDYGLKKPDYLTAFMQAIDWAKVEERFLDE